MLGRVLILLSFVLLGAGCDSYEKLLRSTDYEKKYEAALKYYEEGDYDRAYPLLEELSGIYRGTERAEKIYYLFAQTNYHLDDYIMAAYHFKNFVRTFPTSQYAEESLYMNALCHYHNSPEYSLDQSATSSAITEFQLFVNRYPSSERVRDANAMIDKLRNKLERKAYEQVKLFFKTENYQSAVVAADNMIRDFPGSKYTEELSFIRLQSRFLFAINSIDSKKEERIAETLKDFSRFKEQFPSSSYNREAQSIQTAASRMMEDIAFTIPAAAFRRGYYKEAYNGFSRAVREFPSNPNTEEAAYRMIHALYRHGEESEGFEKLRAYEEVPGAYDLAKTVLKSPVYIKSSEEVANQAADRYAYWSANLAGWFLDHRQYENAVEAAFDALEKGKGDSLVFQRIILESYLEIADKGPEFREKGLEGFRKHYLLFSGLDTEYRKSLQEAYHEIYLEASRTVNQLINRREYDTALEHGRRYLADEGLAALHDEIGLLMLKAYRRQITREKDPARASRRWEVAGSEFNSILNGLKGKSREKGADHLAEIKEYIKSNQS